MAESINWEFSAFAVWSEEFQVWYPNVKCLCNGVFWSHREYIIGFEDKATAETFARTFMREEFEQMKAITGAASSLDAPPQE